jgi:lipopolysaccharide transport system permease protein
MPTISLKVFREAFTVLYRHRVLTFEMARRDIMSRHAGQLLGAGWVIFHPLVLVGVYLVVFRFIFNLRTGGIGFQGLDYSAYLLAGLLPWLAFQEAMNKGVAVIVANATIVKQVVFPVEVLPIKVVLAAFVPQLIGTVIFVGYVLVTSGSLPVLFALVPALWILQALAMIGAAYLLAAIGAYIKDIKEMVAFFGAIGMYLVPIAYPPDLVPEKLLWLLRLNPFSHMVWCYQDACFYGSFAHPASWAVYGIGSIATFFAGYLLFRRLKPTFGSVI